jgi:GntR family transcriptional regulator
MPRKREKTTSGLSDAASNGQKWFFEPLDKKSFTPMYFQIQTQLLKMIQAGKLRPGDSLPSEEELSRICGVSRMTSRQALQALKNQGLVSRHKGQGSFVNQPRVEKDITHLSGFSAEMRALGLRASSRVLSTITMPATAEIASNLSIAVNAPVFSLLRLRLADDLPVAIEEIHLPQERFAGIEMFDFSRFSLYQTLREKYEVRVSRADEILEARSATRREAELLDVHVRSSLLVISRTLWNTDGMPVETAHSVYRGDRYRAVLSIPATEIQ